jgi:hypothetical protein
VTRLNASEYEGTFSASIWHAIATEDDAFKSAFLRPISVTLQDDSPCGENATTVEVDRIRKCGCKDDFFVENTDPLFCESVTQCAKCPDGMTCNDENNRAGQILQSAKLDPGYYRTSNQTANVVECPSPKWQCIGNATFGDSLCRTGHEGPFCMLCTLGEEVRYVRSGDSCLPCDSGQETYLMMLMVGFTLLACAVAVYISCRVDKTPAQSVKVNTRGKGRKDTILKLVSYKQRSIKKFLFFDADVPGRWEAFAMTTTAKYKIVVPFTQILHTISTQYPMELPPTFTNYQAKTNLLGFMDVDIIPFNCLLDVNFHDKLFTVTLVPLFSMLLVLLLYTVQYCLLRRAPGPKRATRILELQAKCVYVVLVFLYAAFPILSALVIQTFAYDDRLSNGRGGFLKADYSIQQDDPTQQAMEWYGMLMGLFYCVGIPSASFALLHWKKTAIQKLQAVNIDFELLLLSFINILFHYYRRS